MSESHDHVLEQIKIQQLTSNYLDKSASIEGMRVLTIPKDAVNGDFHVAIRNGNSIYLLVADGVGHGLSAVIPGLRFPSMFVELVNNGHSILTIASQLNEELCRYKHKGYFIAMTLVQINEYEGFIEVLNCGNPSALLVGDDGIMLHKFCSKSLACGIMENDAYELLTERFQCKEPAKLYVFTDGIQDTLIQGGRCKNIAEHELLYVGKAERNKRFDSICSDVEKAQLNGKMDDITLLEVSIHSAKHSVENRTVVVNKQDDNGSDGPFLQCRVLCIDPDKSSLDSIARNLGQHVRNIDLCETVDEAIIAYQYKPDLIIIDLVFLLKHQSELAIILPQYGAVVPVVACCEPSNVIVAEQLFSLLIARYLRKPLILDELVNVVRQCAYQLRQQQKWQLPSSVFLTSSLAMTITDANKKIIQVNDAFSIITGYKKEEVINCNLRLLSSGKHDAAFYKEMWDSINATGHWSGEIWNKRKNGDLFLEWITINATIDAEGEVVSYCSVFADITERRAVEEAVRKLSYYDDLTGLPNRRLFKSNLEQELKQADKEQYKFAVLFLDIDNFKEVNDTMGHDCGDFILKKTADRLNRCLRNTDFIARMGGDEFTICISPYDSSNDIDIIIEKILLVMRKPFTLKEETIYLSMSIGVVDYSSDTNEVSALLKNADQAMFYAKQKGRNCAHFFTPLMESTALERKTLIQDLRLALQNKEFELFYQPIVDLHTGVTYKAEALIRWHHPKKGLISPDKFIPIAEETGLIIEIGDWVFKQATNQSSQWRTKIHEQFQISINKSPKQFEKESNSHKDWLAYLDKKQCSPGCISIEITEGVMMDSKDFVTEQLLAFRDQGIEVSLDDFGTGYSSLAYLRKFDIDYIKIDRQFVQHVDTNSDDQALCKAIIVMAHALGIKVIAEGIETAGQRDFLCNAGCDYGQGYLFSKPIPADQFEKLMDKS
ncbi:MAG: hypothetical protein COA95_05635 [Methylophaga sp.]|nr:MAG: hypothetical protein COA95_05635 [Methylophaga sp.]